MLSEEGNENSKNISVTINNQSIKNEVDLISSQQRIVNNADISLSMGNEINNSNFNNKNLTNNSDITNSPSLDLLFGVPYEIKHPKKIGNLRALLYANDFPLIVIGEKCKSVFSFIYKFYLS